MPGTNVIYNSTSIQSTNVIVTKVEHETIPKKSMNKYPVVRSNRSQITPPSYFERAITVTGKIIGSSISNVNQLADEFKEDMNPSANSANLDIDHRGGTRRYVATIDDCIIEPVDALFGRNFTLTFLCVNPPWGIDTSATTLINDTNHTTSPINHSITVGGNSIEQVPIISYTLNSFSGAAVNTIYFKNPVSGQEISVPRKWVAGDEIIITPGELSATVNGDEVDYDGAFPAYDPGVGTLAIRDNFTARDYDLTVTQVNRWW